MWYLDDGVLVGTPEQISSCFAYLRTHLAKLGLQVNTKKCSVWGPGAKQCSGLLDTKVIPWLPSTGITVLGTPIPYPGSLQYLEDFWDTRNELIRETLDKLTCLTDTQIAHHLLRKCLDGCKVNHLLRATDCYATDKGLRTCDTAILQAFEDIVGEGLTPHQLLQASQPLRAGGCGIRSPLVIRPAARIAALASFVSEGAARVGVPGQARLCPGSWIGPPLAELCTILGQNFDPLPSWLHQPEKIGFTDDNHNQQKWWSQSVGKKTLLGLLDTVSPRDQARLLEQQGGVGASFMAATPAHHSRTKIPSDQYRLGLRWWLGKPLISLGGSADELKCPGCQESLDPFGDHLLCCKRNNFQKRHMAVQLALAEILDESGQSYSLEEQIPGAETSLRPADVLLKGWFAGKDTALDITICHGWQGTLQSASRERWRAFLRKKEKEKHNKYDVLCQAAQWEMRAMAFGTWGGMGPEGAWVLNRLIKRAASWHDGDLRVACQDRLQIQVGIALMTSVWQMLYNKNLV